MKEYNKVLESKMKIRFHDCDPFNHLNNSRYIDYMVTARGDQLLDNYDFDIYKLAEQQGLGWVTAQTQISYLVPAYLMEEVVIQTQLLHFSDKSLLFEATMWNSDKTILKSVMWVKLVHYNLRTQRSHTHDQNLVELFRHVVHPIESNPSFDERVKKLKSGISSFSLSH